MTTARALLRRLIFHGRVDPTLTSEAPPVEQRLEAARQRLKQTIPSPPEEPAPGVPPAPGQTIPPPEGVSPGQESPPVR